MPNVCGQKITRRDSDKVVSDVVRASHPNLTDYSSHFVGRWCRRGMNLSITIGLKAVQPRAMQKETNWIPIVTRIGGIKVTRINKLPLYHVIFLRTQKGEEIDSWCRLCGYSCMTRSHEQDLRAKRLYSRGKTETKFNVAPWQEGCAPTERYPKRRLTYWHASGLCLRISDVRQNFISDTENVTKSDETNQTEASLFRI